MPATSIHSWWLLSSLAVKSSQWSSLRHSQIVLAVAPLLCGPMLSRCYLFYALALSDALTTLKRQPVLYWSVLYMYSIHRYVANDGFRSSLHAWQPSPLLVPPPLDMPTPPRFPDSLWEPRPPAGLWLLRISFQSCSASAHPWWLMEMLIGVSRPVSCKCIISEIVYWSK
jgi:hypothetical protein